MPVATVVPTAVRARVGLAGTVAVARVGSPPTRVGHRGRAVPNRFPGMLFARRRGQRWKPIRPKPRQNRRQLVLAGVPSPHRGLLDAPPPVLPADATPSRTVAVLPVVTAPDQGSDGGRVSCLAKAVRSRPCPPDRVSVKSPVPDGGSVPGPPAMVAPPRFASAALVRMDTFQGAAAGVGAVHVAPVLCSRPVAPGALQDVSASEPRCGTGVAERCPDDAGTGATS